MWPQLAPPAIKVAVGGLYVIVALVLVSVLLTFATASGGRSGSLTSSLVIGDIVLLAVLLLVARGVAVGRPWARWATLVVCVLGALSGLTLLPSSSLLIQVVAVGQVVVFIAIAIALLVRDASAWFRPLP